MPSCEQLERGRPARFSRIAQKTSARPCDRRCAASALARRDVRTPARPRRAPHVALCRRRRGRRTSRARRRARLPAARVRRRPACAHGAGRPGARAAADDAARERRERARSARTRTRASILSPWRPPTGARPSPASRSSRSIRRTMRRRRWRRPGEYPVHARPVPRHVPRAAVDDPPVRRLRVGRGVERALPLPARRAGRRASRSRSTCRRSSATTPTTRARSARSGAPASRSTRSPTWRSCSAASRSARCRRR